MSQPPSFPDTRTRLAAKSTTMPPYRTGLALDRTLHQAAIHFGETLTVIGNLALMFIGMAHWLDLRRLWRQEILPLSHLHLAAVLAVPGLALLWEVMPSMVVP